MPKNLRNITNFAPSKVIPTRIKTYFVDGYFLCATDQPPERLLGDTRTHIFRNAFSFMQNFHIYLSKNKARLNEYEYP